MVKKRDRIMREQVERLQNMLEKAKTSKDAFQSVLDRSSPGSKQYSEVEHNIGILERGIERIQGLIEKIRHEVSLPAIKVAIARRGAKKKPEKKPAKEKKKPKKQQKKKTVKKKPKKAKGKGRNR